MNRFRYKNENKIQQSLDSITSEYFNSNPLPQFSNDISKELEVRFGTKNIVPITKNIFDNVIKKLTDTGFTCDNFNGNYMLRITNEFINKDGRKIDSNIRTEINGLQSIKQYCKTENISQLSQNSLYSKEIIFTKKDFIKKKDVNNEKEVTIKPYFSDEFNFKCALQSEENIEIGNYIVDKIINSWEGTKKSFRYIRRYQFKHPDYPIFIDLSVVKSSIKQKYHPFLPIKTYTLDESNVFNNSENYEIELEIDNDKVGPNTKFTNSESLIPSIKKCIKYILCGMQNTNYPVSYIELNNIKKHYSMLIHDIKKDEKEIPDVTIKNFIGPNSYTLQINNIIDDNNDLDTPNIRNNFTVTDKADGDRALLYISKQGKIYLIDTNMNVRFSGAITGEKNIYNSLLDGELITKNKLGENINLFAAFDIYYYSGHNVRHYNLISDIIDPNKEEESVSSEEKKKKKSGRLDILKKCIANMKHYSVTDTSRNKDQPNNLIRIIVKHFEIAVNDKQIFTCCNNILSKISHYSYEYNTDGLIFTPAFMGLPKGTNKVTWHHSFKWKPPEFNTVDFLVSTKKDQNNKDIIKNNYMEGVDLSSGSKIIKSKTLILMCGFKEKDHGYVNPCNDIVNDIIPEKLSYKKSDSIYQPMPFYPTNPYDSYTHLCDINLNLDEYGNEHMFTEEQEIIEDNSIVEFKYDLNLYKWIPLRVRHDKTAQFRNGQRNYGNPYHVANSNWFSIHNPITQYMITTGKDIPTEIQDEKYYDRKKGISNTRLLRDFHNLFVKKILITSASKPGDTLIDFAVGKGGDFPKWITSELSFVYGIDKSRDNIEHKFDGACARYLNSRKERKSMPYALFVEGDSSLNIRNGEAIKGEVNKTTNAAIFGLGPKEESKIGKGVLRQYGKGKEGFNVTSCQFALHYFFENIDSLQTFLQNVSSSTKVGGYFIGTSYDGKSVFNKLKYKNIGESISIFNNDNKIWEVTKEYSSTSFEPDDTSVGYAINVYQESINKSAKEFLVNYDYLTRIMENYGFIPAEESDISKFGLTNSIGSFQQLYLLLESQIKDKFIKEKKIENILNISNGEKEISFLNKYFIFKKIRNVNVEDVVLHRSNIIKSLNSDSNKPTTVIKKTSKKLIIKQI